MAILKSLIVRGGSKQIGGMVLYSRNGETVARELAAQVSNPRTPSQMNQRVKLSNLVSVYRANLGWMKGAFENKKERESDYNAFVSANVGTNLVALSKSDVAAGAAVVGPYKISSGSLPIIETVLNGTDLVSNLYLGTLTISGATTVGELSTALLNNNNGLEAGMQLSVIINLQLASAGGGVPYVTTRAYEVIIKTDDTQLLSNLVPEGVLASVGSTNKSLAISTTDLGDGAAAFVLSKTTGGNIKVSTQSLVFFGSNATYRNYTSEAAWNRAILSYGEGDEPFLSSNSAAAANSVAGTLALLGFSYFNHEYIAGAELTDVLAANATVKFLFNRTIASGSTVSAYYTIGTSATKYNLTNVAIDTTGRAIEAKVGSTTLPDNSEAFTMVAVIDGDEYPISLIQHRNDME